MTCRDDEALVGVLPQRQQRRTHGLRAESQSLTHGDRACSLVGPNNNKLHSGLPSYKPQVACCRPRKITAQCGSFLRDCLKVGSARGENPRAPLASKTLNIE